MTKKSVKMLEIPIRFHNYKLLKDASWVLKGSHVYFVQGPNDVGKTSFLNALQGAMTAKDLTDKKVSVNADGEDSGYYEFVIPAADGSIITIRNEFTDKKNRFIAVKENGEKVSSVSEIRSLFNYTPINVSEFFAMSRSAEGRRKQRDIILKLLPDNARERFVELDLQEQHYFKERSEVKRNLESATGYMDSTVIPDKDLDLLKNEQQVIDLLSRYEKSLGISEELNKIDVSLKNNENERERIAKRLSELDIYDAELNESKDKLTKGRTNLSDAELEIKIEKGKEIAQSINEIKAKQTLYKESSEKHALLTQRHNELSVEIETRRKDKAHIVSSADLPVDNISFEEDFLIINDFKFDENQVCESDAVLLLANILAKINPGPIQVIGDASILDAKKLEELVEIAEANNKVMFVDEVVRDASEMVVVGYEDTIGVAKLPNKENKPTKSPKITQGATQKEKPEKPSKIANDADDNVSDNSEPNNKPLF